MIKLYTDYKYYSEEYKGTLSEDEFNKVVTRASQEVRNNILNRDITGYEDEVQSATCSVADILYKIEQLENHKLKLTSNSSKDKIITSEKVGDLSRNYAKITNVKELEEEISNQKRKIQEEIENYLLFTGLLDRRCLLYGGHI